MPEPLPAAAATSFVPSADDATDTHCIAALLYDDEARDSMRDLVALDDFVSTQPRLLYSVLLTMLDARIPIDRETLRLQLRKTSSNPHEPGAATCWVALGWDELIDLESSHFH